MSRPLRVAWMYPLPKRAALEAYRRGEEPDQLSGIDAIRKYGVEPDLIDPYPVPLNPWCGRHSLYSGIDVARALKVFAKLSRYDVVLSVGETSALVLIALRQLTGFRKPIVIWDPAIGGNWRMRERILDWTLPHCDRILVVGQNQEQFIRRQYQPAPPVRAISHWEDTDFYHPVPPPPAGYVLAVGVDPMRDYATLIEAARGMAIEVKIKTSRSIDVPLPSNVSIIRERMSYLALRELYAGAAIVVVPLLEAQHASGVNGILEGYAMGKPTIVSESTGTRDFTIPGETALLVPSGDTASLRAAIQTLMESPELASRLAVAGRRHVEQHFSVDVFAKRLAAELYATAGREFDS